MNQNCNTMNQGNIRMVRGGCMHNSTNRQGYEMNRGTDGQRRYDNRSMNAGPSCSNSRQINERRNCDGNREMTERRGCDSNCEMDERRTCDRDIAERRTCDGKREIAESRTCDGNREASERRTCDGRREMACVRSVEIPTGSRKQLFCFINEVSFAVYEALLYLDTHPNDQEAMEYFREYNHLRNRALQEYARLYGPLTISTANDHESRCWEWMNQPWPWEGGDC